MRELKKKTSEEGRGREVRRREEERRLADLPIASGPVMNSSNGS